MSVLSLVGNELYGAIPDTIGQLSDVTQFQMGENSFSGTLPESLFEIQSLETISFYQNYLYGTIPNVIGKMRNLKGFWMYDNYLSGTIPEDITNLDFLSTCHGSGLRIVTFLFISMCGTVGLTP